MILTIAEGKLKFCLAQLGNPNVAEFSLTCVTDECMAWRWFERMPYKLVPKDIGKIDRCFECGALIGETGPNGNEWAKDKEGFWRCPLCGVRQSDSVDQPERRRGYCGLAGRVGVI